MRIAHMDEGRLNLALFAYGISTLVGTKLGGWAADRFGVRWTLMGGMAAQALIVVVLFACARTDAVTFPLLLLWGTAAWTSGPALYQNLLAIAPEAAGILMSLNSTCVQLGWRSARSWVGSSLAATRFWPLAGPARARSA